MTDDEKLARKLDDRRELLAQSIESELDRRVPSVVRVASRRVNLNVSESQAAWLRDLLEDLP